MKRRNLLRAILSVAGLGISLAACQEKKSMNTQADPNSPAARPAVPEGTQSAVFGAGCFWCSEAAFRQVKGVISVTSGYMGGKTANPTYRQVCEEDTGHAEVVKVVFDPKKVSYDNLLEWFWQLHDPTTLNRQGNDTGTQYRSVIFYDGEAQKQAALASKAAAAPGFRDPIVTEISPATVFYPAENYHQDYYFQNKSKNRYCTLVIAPKLKKLNLKD